MMVSMESRTETLKHTINNTDSTDTKQGRLVRHQREDNAKCASLITNAVHFEQLQKC
jgi:hypothetical protein